MSEVLNELHRSQESAYNLRDSARQSHLNRAKLCSKLIKYPHVEDYTVRVVSLAHFVLLNILYHVSSLQLETSSLKNQLRTRFHCILTPTKERNVCPRRAARLAAGGLV